jgi:hypothetical protein
MNELAVPSGIPAMSDAAIEKVRRLESLVLAAPQVPLETSHIFHAGLYARTIRLPAGVMITGALIKIATLLIVQGDAIVYLDGESVRLEGYNVLPASARRKQAFVALAETHLTMIFATEARTVEEAEAEFTDEADLLGSSRDSNRITITGE